MSITFDKGDVCTAHCAESLSGEGLHRGSIFTSIFIFGATALLTVTQKDLQHHRQHRQIIKSTFEQMTLTVLDEKHLCFQQNGRLPTCSLTHSISSGDQIILSVEAEARVHSRPAHQAAVNTQYWDVTGNCRRRTRVFMMKYYQGLLQCGGVKHKACGLKPAHQVGPLDEF